MNRDELRDVLNGARVDPLIYRIGGEAHEALCLTVEGEAFHVFLSERGTRYEERTFNVEDDACVYFLTRILQLWPGDPVSGGDVPLIRVGYWKGEDATDWPDVRSLVDRKWDDAERNLVARYVRHGTAARAYMGFSRCRMCGLPNGSLEFTDGTFVWPEGLAHYVDEHGVRLPEEFVDHIRLRMDQLDDAVVDSDWWRRHTGS